MLKEIAFLTSTAVNDHNNVQKVMEDNKLEQLESIVFHKNVFKYPRFSERRHPRVEIASQTNTIMRKPHFCLVYIAIKNHFHVKNLTLSFKKILSAKPSWGSIFTASQFPIPYLKIPLKMASSSSGPHSTSHP